MGKNSFGCDSFKSNQRKINDLNIWVVKCTLIRHYIPDKFNAILCYKTISEMVLSYGSEKRILYSLQAPVSCLMYLLFGSESKLKVLVK